MESELLNNLGPAAQRRAKSEPVTALDTNAEKALAKDRPDARLHSINGFLPSFAAKNFNLGAGFSGPNCYNTALVTTGGLPAGEVRYISSSEFEAILRLRYKRLAGPEPGCHVTAEAIPHDHSRKGLRRDGVHRLPDHPGDEEAEDAGDEEAEDAQGVLPPADGKVRAKGQQLADGLAPPHPLPIGNGSRAKQRRNRRHAAAP